MTKEFDDLKKDQIKNLKEQIIVNTKMLECVNEEEEYNYYLKENKKARETIKELRK